MKYYFVNKIRNKDNVLELLNCRQLTSCGLNSVTTRCLRNLLKSKCRDYQDIWDKSTHSPIAFDGHLYLSNFQLWFGGCFNGDGTPHLLYNKSDRRTNWRIEDALRIEGSGMHHIDGEKGSINYVTGYSPCLFAVTSDGWLIRYSVCSTWKTLDRVYLSTRYHFRHISWASNVESFVLKSIRFCGPGSISRSRGESLEEKPFLYLALFKAAPLKYIANIGVLKNVWGNDLIDANISHGMFITMHRRDIMKFYDVDYIISTYQERMFDIGDEIPSCFDFAELFPGQSSDLQMPQYIGKCPLGIPVTLKKVEKPPLLLQLTSCHSMVSFGGFPWKAIVSKSKHGDVFHVYDVRKGSLNAVIKTEIDPDAEERTYFHEDDSGRILSLDQQTLSCLSLPSDTAGEKKCLCDFTIDIRNTNTTERSKYSHSGRSIKWRNQDSVTTDYNMIHGIDYDDELDAIAVLASNSVSCKGVIGLYDNQRGQLIRNITLTDTFDESDLWSVFLERDLIFYMCRKLSSGNKFKCKILRLLESRNNLAVKKHAK